MILYIVTFLKEQTFGSVPPDNFFVQATLKTGLYIMAMWTGSMAKQTNTALIRISHQLLANVILAYEKAI